MYVSIKSKEYQGVYQSKNVNHIFKMTKLLTFSDGENIFKKRNIVFFHIHSFKNRDNELCFLKAPKDSSTKIGCHRRSGG